MSPKRLLGKEDRLGERGNEYLLPRVGGLQADQAEDKQPPSRWWWFGLGDSQDMATDERERQIEVPKTTNLAKENVVRPQGVVEMGDIRGVTKKFPNPSVNNFTKKNLDRAQGTAKTKPVCRNSSIYPNPSEKREKLNGMALQNFPKSPNKVKKTKTLAEMKKNLRDVKKSSIKQPRETTTTTGRTKTVAEMDKVTGRAPHHTEAAGFSRPSVPPNAAIAKAPGGQTSNLKVAVALLLVFHMVLVHLFGYFWLSLAATD